MAAFYSSVVFLWPRNEFYLSIYEVLLQSSWIVIVVTASVKEERGGQGHTSASLLHQVATWHCAVNTHCFYTSAFWRVSFFLWWMAKSSNVSALSFAWISVICYQNPWNASWGFWRTFFKPDSSFWMPFMFQGQSYVSWRWQTFSVTKHQQNDRKCWKIREFIHEDCRQTIHELTDTAGISYEVS
jgi:hypothetical protein